MNSVTATAVLNTNAANQPRNKDTYYEEPTGIAKARYVKWHKSFLEKSQNELLALTRKRFDVNSASMIFVQDVSHMISVTSGDFDNVAFLESGDYYFHWYIQEWMFENDIQAIIRTCLTIAAWPEEPANDWARIYVTVIEFKDVSSLTYFKLRWFDN
jgi:hypothetical protein